MEHGKEIRRRDAEDAEKSFHHGGPRRDTEERGERGVEKIGGGDWGDCVGWFQAASGWHLDQERATPRAVLGPQDTGKQSLASGTRKRGRREEFSPRRATEIHGGKRGEMSGEERRGHRGIEPFKAAVRGVAPGSEVSHATGPYNLRLEETVSAAAGSARAMTGQSGEACPGILRGINFQYKSYCYEAPFGIGHLTAQFSF